jgi:hypothetical protein
MSVMDTNYKTPRQKASGKAAVQQKLVHIHNIKKRVLKIFGKLKKKIFPLSKILKHPLIIALVTVFLTLFTQELIDSKSPEITGKPVGIRYNPKYGWSNEKDGQTTYKNYVCYSARAYLKALNKTYHVSESLVFIYLKTGDIKEGILKKGILKRVSPPVNSVTIYDPLLSLEKDKDYLCDITFYLEDEHINSIAEMAFDKIELRLYDNYGRYKKVELFQSDFPE